MKVWIYKGDILPYKAVHRGEDRQGGRHGRRRDLGPGRAPRRRVLQGPSPGRRAAPAEAEAATAEGEEARPLIHEADPEFEKLLEEEEAIERSVREHHETPHFRPGDGD